MSDIVQIAHEAVPAAGAKVPRVSGFRALAAHVRRALQSHAAAAADARLVALTGVPITEQTRQARLYRQSYRPGSLGDPL